MSREALPTGQATSIDLFVVVEDDRLQAQRAAHTIEQAIAEQRFDGERYEAHIIVESRRTAATHDRIDEILVEGITLRESEPLAAVKRAVFDNGAG